MIGQKCSRMRDLEWFVVTLTSVKGQRHKSSEKTHIRSCFLGSGHPVLQAVTIHQQPSNDTPEPFILNPTVSSAQQDLWFNLTEWCLGPWAAAEAAGKDGSKEAGTPRRGKVKQECLSFCCTSYEGTLITCCRCATTRLSEERLKLNMG